MTSKFDSTQYKLVAVDSSGQHTHVTFGEFQRSMDLRLDDLEQRLLGLEAESPHNGNVPGSTVRTQENG
jgi:hypothetical protein